MKALMAQRKGLLTTQEAGGNHPATKWRCDVRAVRTLLMGRRGRWLAIALTLLMLHLDLMPAIANKNLFQNEDDVVVVCPLIIISSDELRRALLDPYWFLAEYRHQWTYINGVVRTYVNLTTPDCEPEDQGYKCRGCKSLSAVYWECSHTDMDPNKPCGRQRYGDREVEDRKICYKIEISAKTCRVSSEGQQMDCRVKSRSPRTDQEGQPIEGSIFRMVSILYRDREECVEQSREVVTETAMVGCPTCEEEVVARMRCLANRQSQRYCQNGYFDPILTGWGGKVYYCVSNCDEDNQGNQDTPKEEGNKNHSEHDV